MSRDSLDTHRWYTRLAPLGLLALLIVWASTRKVPEPSRVVSPMIHGGLAAPSSGDASRAEQLDRMTHHLDFDRGELGLQVTPPDPDAAEAWVPPIIVRKSSTSPPKLPDRRTRWRHLTTDHRKTLREAIQLHASQAQWRRLVVHASSSPTGDAEMIERSQMRRWPELRGGAYHFVIGNGTYSGDGEIEILPAWRDQQPVNAHDLRSLNRSSLSVCLIGTFDLQEPSESQIAALDELLTYLRAQLGSLELRAHHEVESTAPACPGPNVGEAILEKLRSRS